MINQEPEPYFYLPTLFYIPWYWKGKGVNGHGEMCVKISNRGEDIQIWNENLTKEETKEILHKYVELLINKAKKRKILAEQFDSLVDNAKMCEIEHK